MEPGESGKRLAAAAKPASGALKHVIENAMILNQSMEGEIVMAQPRTPCNATQIYHAVIINI